MSAAYRPNPLGRSESTIDKVLLGLMVVLSSLLISSPSPAATWQKTGKYPLIAGTWWEWEEKNILVTIAQHRDKFIATCSYRNDDNTEIRWRAEGTISDDGEITANLVHTRPEGYKSQTRTAKLAPDGKTISGHAAWDDGGHDFTWTLKKPSGASRSIERHVFVPPHGKCLLLVGQDNKSIDDYVAATGTVPGGVMVYTGVQDFGNAADFDYLLKKYPRCAFQIGLYMVDALDRVGNGECDDNIKQLGEWIKSSRRPVFLRVGYEFDYPANKYQPDKYVKTFRHVHDLLDDQEIVNVAYVWHSFAAGAARIEDWYPGDDYVDWVAVSLFAQPIGQVAPVAEYARRRGKPLMIAESTPFGLRPRTQP
jgi:hypothetical protein